MGEIHCSFTCKRPGGAGEATLEVRSGSLKPPETTKLTPIVRSLVYRTSEVCTRGEAQATVPASGSNGFLGVLLLEDFGLHEGYSDLALSLQNTGEFQDRDRGYGTLARGWIVPKGDGRSLAAHLWQNSDQLLHETIQGDYPNAGGSWEHSSFDEVESRIGTAHVRWGKLVPDSLSEQLSRAVTKALIDTELRRSPSVARRALSEYTPPPRPPEAIDTSAGTEVNIMTPAKAIPDLKEQPLSPREPLFPKRRAQENLVPIRSSKTLASRDISSRPTSLERPWTLPALVALSFILLAIILALLIPRNSSNSKVLDEIELIAILEKEKGKLSTENSSLRNKNTRLQSRIDDLAEQLQESRQMHVGLEDRIANTQERVQLSNRGYEADLKISKARNEYLSKKREILKSENSQLAEKLEKSKREEDRLSKELKKSEEDGWKLTEELKKAEKGREIIAKKLETSEENGKQLDAELKRAQKNGKQLAKKLRRSEENEKRLTKRLREAEEKRKRFAAELKKSQVKEKLSSKELETSRAQLTKVHAELSARDTGYIWILLSLLAGAVLGFTILPQRRRT